MSGPLRSACLVLASAWLLASHAVAGHVIVVDSGGGGDYFRIQRAVDAAVDGDTILVKAGSYPGFMISDKRVYVVAEHGELVTVNGTVFVLNLAASRDVVIAGLSVQGSTHGLQLVSNAGSVRVQACSLIAASLTGPQRYGALVTNCSDVTFTSCTLEGGVDDYLSVSSLSGSGLRATGSSVALYDCIARGADGYDEEPNCPNENQGGYAGSGAWVSSSFVFASGSSFDGGEGGDARSGCGYSGDGGAGGDGLRADSGSTASVLGCSFAGGQGGSEGCGPMGCFGFDGYHGQAISLFAGATLTTLPGTARKLTMPAVAREWPAAVPVSIQGQPGDHVFLCLSRQTAFQYVANQSGVRATPLSPPPVVIDLGIVPGGGTLSTTIPSYELQGTIESRAYFFQTLHKLPSGPRVLGSPANLIVLDSSF